ncbi:MAG: hypothetical protein J1E62_06020 [Lachnospiraceae bacterium]|nr:hypothetical protein [Lachnospiraceae bacterium]
MNQYQRMICYLYEYNNGQKGANVGYVRLEQRGERCRVQIQMRGRNLGKPPIATFFKQESTGIQLFRIGEMQEGKGGLVCRVESRVDNLLEKGWTLDEMDGIFLFVSGVLYFASTWKLQNIYVGRLTWWSEEHVLTESSENTEEFPRQEEETSAADMDDERHDPATEETAAGQEQGQFVPERELSVAELEEQAVCERCPFKRKEMDYGKRMLVTFPSMHPFGADYHGKCVRIEPQDLGCLPMSLWPLSGNSFLMQGYFNYRHLIFMEWEQASYAIGVPGIYSETAREQGASAGFTEFMAICGPKNCRGAFGYWLMPLSVM